jgi:hypothetical protein
MKVGLLGIFILLLTASCKNDNEARKIAQKVEEVKQDSIFKEITKLWQFEIPTSKTLASTVLKEWSAWQDLMAELRQKPSVNIENYQLKAGLLSQKVKILLVSTPIEFQKPEILSRILVLQTRINSLDLYINLDRIPLDLLKKYFFEINEELNAITAQMDAVFIRAEIPVEEGELEAIQQLKDTTRQANFRSKNDSDFE